MSRMALRDADRVAAGFGRTYTNLSPQEADEVRAYCKRTGTPFPREPMERVRLYYEEVSGRPVPKEILAATGRPAHAPDASPSAARLAEEYGLDLHLISGSGARGKIVVKDVREKLRELREKIEGAMEQAAFQVTGEKEVGTTEGSEG